MHFQEGSEHSKFRALYGGGMAIDDRHRHRYEVNPEYVELDDMGKRMEILELKDHQCGLWAHNITRSTRGRCSIPRAASSWPLPMALSRPHHEEDPPGEGTCRWLVYGTFL